MRNANFCVNKVIKKSKTLLGNFFSCMKNHQKKVTKASSTGNTSNQQKVHRKTFIVQNFNRLLNNSWHLMKTFHFPCGTWRNKCISPDTFLVETETWWKKFHFAPASTPDRYNMKKKKWKCDLYKNFIFQTPLGIVSAASWRRWKTKPESYYYWLHTFMKTLSWIQSCFFARCLHANLHSHLLLDAKRAETADGAREAVLVNCNG